MKIVSIKGDENVHLVCEIAIFGNFNVHLLIEVLLFIAESSTNLCINLFCNCKRPELMKG